MEAIATPHRFDGEAFVASVAERGSAPVVAPLGVFLDRCSTMPDLRKQVRDSLPALLADVAHFMAITHGRHPGIIEQAATRIVEQDARGWIIAASDAFAAERMFLNRLTVVAGPIRRHFDQDKVNATLAGQHRSFEMLATSDRRGCAAGAVTAFVVDWLETRPVLERVALMLGVEVPSCTLPSKGPLCSTRVAIGSNDFTRTRLELWGPNRSSPSKRVSGSSLQHATQLLIVVEK
jgi:hypothetical protein